MAAQVSDPGGAPVTITFGWAAGDPETDLTTLISAADEMLLVRKAELGRLRRTPRAA